MVSAIGFTLCFFHCTIFFNYYWYLHPHDPLRFHQIMHTLFIFWSTKCCRSNFFQGVFKRFFHYLLSVHDGHPTFILFFFVFKRFFHYLLSVHDRHPTFILFFFVFNIYDVPLSRRYCKFTILAIWVQFTFVLLFYLS